MPDRHRATGTTRPAPRAARPVQPSSSTFLSRLRNKISNTFLTSCWLRQINTNLALPSDFTNPHERCNIRFHSLAEAQNACFSFDWCEGVVSDAGLQCSQRMMHFELRTSKEIDVGDGHDITTWFLHKGSCRNHPPLARALDKSVGDEVRSQAHCVGQCCSEPLARNRSCAFTNLLFRPPRSLFFLTDADGFGEVADGAQRTTYLHNRFRGGAVLGEKSRGLFNPKTAPPAMAAGIRHVVDTALYIGSDLHKNHAHLMLDSVFPAVAALVRLQASLRTSSQSDQFQLPEPVDGNFTFLLLDPWGGPDGNRPQWHRGQNERAWTSQLAGGHGVVDVAQLAVACPQGCLLSRAFAGAGHIGLCAVDDKNVIGGSREHRALWMFRMRIYRRWGLPAPPGPSAAWGLPVVLVIQSKRVVSNLDSFVQSANRLRIAAVRKIRWEDMPFREQLLAIDSAAVMISGVGSAQINQFLLPAQSVAVCLGWWNPSAKDRIHYFDHHVLRSLDHVRALYYPSFDPWEIQGTASTGHVRLNLTKANRLLSKALAIYKSGFKVPVPLDANANRFDRAFEALVARSGGAALMDRTDDRDWRRPPPPPRCSNKNGIEELVYGRDTENECSWGHLLPALRRDFDL